MAGRDEERGAGRVIYGSMTQVNQSDSSALLPPPTITVNHRADGPNVSVEESLRMRPMSPLRRTFCLVLTFDVIISLVLWLLFTEIKTNNGSEDEFNKQVMEFDFKTSLFDTVLLSLFRFTSLLLAYGLYRSKVPWFVAATTVVTCTYMVVKIVLFHYDKVSESALVILDYIELIAPIILSWVEVWLMDLKVIPEERRELETLLAAERRSLNDDLNERAPLLSRFLRPPQTEQSFYSPQPSEAGDSYYENSDEDNRSFHSARTSKSHSRTHSGTHSLMSSTSQGAYYKSLIASGQRLALDLINCDEGWSKESGADEVDGVVYSKQTKDYGKIFKLIAEIDVDALTYYNDIVDNAAGIPKWNPTVLEVRCLEVIDDNTEVSYNVAAEGAGGMVSSRDFVCVRHWEQLDGWYISTTIGTEHSSMPPQSKYVRGEQGPGIIRLKDVGTSRHRMEWLLNTNLKGWLPQYLIDQALSGVMLSYLKNLRKHATTLTSTAES